MVQTNATKKSNCPTGPETIKNDIEVQSPVGTAIEVTGGAMRRNFSTLSIIALGFNTSESWAGLGASLPLAIASGGTVTLLYGIIIVSFTLGCTGLSLAELASVYPTAGGQYHFSSFLAPSSHSRIVPYICGFTGVLSWIAISASAAMLFAQCLLAIVINYMPLYTPKTWHYFLIYQIAHIVMIMYNLFLIRKSVWVYKLGCEFGLPWSQLILSDSENHEC